MYQMEENNSTGSNIMNASSENSQYELHKSMANGFISTDTSHDNPETYEPVEVSISMLRGVELANFADRFSNVETSQFNTGYAILFGFSVIAFVVVTITNFVSDPALFFSSHSDDLKEGTLKKFSFLLLIVLLYVPFISGTVLVLFGLRKYLPKLVSITFRVATYGVILFASLRLLLSNPIAFLLLIGGIACIWLRKWLSFSIDITRNFLHDFVIMYESFPKFTGLVFFGLLAECFLSGVLSKVIKLTHLHYGIEYFDAHKLNIEGNDKSASSLIKLIILVILYTGQVFIGSVIRSILTAALISAYCLMQYQKDAPLGTPSYKDINFFKLFYTKSFGSICYTSVLPIIARCLQVIFHKIIPKQGSAFTTFLSIFEFLFNMVMAFLDTSALSYMVVNETGYFHSLKQFIKICLQKRWHTFKSFSLIGFSIIIFLVPMLIGESLVVSGCELLASFILDTDYSSLERPEFFEGYSGAFLEVFHVLAICRFILPILVSNRLEIASQNNLITLQDIHLSAEELSNNVY